MNGADIALSFYLSSSIVQVVLFNIKIMYSTKVLHSVKAQKIKNHVTMMQKAMKNDSMIMSLCLF